MREWGYDPRDPDRIARSLARDEWIEDQADRCSGLESEECDRLLQAFPRRAGSAVQAELRRRNEATPADRSLYGLNPPVSRRSPEEAELRHVEMTPAERAFFG